jgi:hypothetical protein
MIELRLSFADADAAIAALSKLGSAAHNANVERTPGVANDVQVEKPKRAPRKAATIAPFEQSVATIAAQLPTTASPPVDLFATSAPAAPPVEQKQPEQKELIAALRAAYEKKAESAQAIVAHFGVKSVGQIPKDKWAEAIAMAQKAVAA